MELKQLLEFNDIVIQCHDDPDADTIASGFGVYRYLKAHGKQPRLIYGGDRQLTKTNLKVMLKLLEIPLQWASELEAPQLLVTVDCVHGERNVTDFAAERYAAIDHHKITENIPEMSEIRSNYGSCATIVCQLLENEGYPLEEDIRLSTALYYGLYSDTACFSEVKHPADRDLRDFAHVDKSVMTLLANCVLSLPELRIAGDALNRVQYNEKNRYAVAIAEPCDPNILGYINDLVLQVDSVDVSVVGCFVKRGFKVSVRSCTAGIHADELARFITDGNGGGHRQKAGGIILSAAADLQKELVDRLDSYYGSFDIIRADEYSPDISSMRKYRKLPETAGFAKTTDIVPAGTDIIIRMIEGDLDIIAADSTYIMIGRNGNIYPISSERFGKLYTASDAPYQIISEYDPRIITRDQHDIRIAQYARCCVSDRNNSCIFARRLDRTLKLFTSWDSSNYMLGEVGDYFAVRSDDLSDMYVIPREQFEPVYRETEE